MNRVRLKKKSKIRSRSHQTVGQIVDHMHWLFWLLLRRSAARYGGRQLELDRVKSIGTVAVFGLQVQNNCWINGLWTLIVHICAVIGLCVCLSNMVCVLFKNVSFKIKVRCEA